MLDFHSGSIMRKHARTLLTVALAAAGIGATSAQEIQLMTGETAPATQSRSDGSGGSMQGMNHGSMQGMDHGSMQMQGGSAPPDARDPDAYSGGYQLGVGKYALGDPSHSMMMADEHKFGSVLLDRLEWVHGNDANATAYELQARFGSTYDKAVLKAEGDVSKGRFEEARTELLWSHAVATFWDTQLGIRNDAGFGRPARNWWHSGCKVWPLLV